MIGKTSLAQNVAHLLLRAYQLSLSGLLGRQCRHLPTCSHFADEAILRHGLWIGGWMGLARLSRCRPFGTAGYDPVPLHACGNAKWWLPWRYGVWRTPPDRDAPS